MGMKLKDFTEEQSLFSYEKIGCVTLMAPLCELGGKRLYMK